MTAHHVSSYGALIQEHNDGGQFLNASDEGKLNMQASTPEYLETCRTALAAEQAESLVGTDGWAHVDKQQVHADWDVLYKTLAGVMDQSDASSVEVQEIMAQHYAIASRFYAPSKEAYIGMALLYDEDPAMRNFHNAYAPNMVQFLGEAMNIYAQRNL